MPDVAALYVKKDGSYAGLEGVDLWDELPKPVRGYWMRDLWDEGWVTEVSQSAYGHPARKWTWLYYVGLQPTDLDWRDLEGIGVVGAGIHSGQSAGRPRVDGYEASRTPESFRDVLLEMARSSALVAA